MKALKSALATELAKKKLIPNNKPFQYNGKTYKTKTVPKKDAL